MNTFDINDLSLSKIKTGVPGFDDLFHGGLRLPNNEQKDGICMVIYGERGVSKSDLALQIMRGVDRYFKTHPNVNLEMSPRFCSLTHREVELEKHYRGAEVVDMLDVIKASDKTSACRLCDYFKDLESLRNMSVRADECGSEVIHECPVCKLVKHGVIVYNSRSQSLHWNVGSMSDEENVVSLMSKEAVDVTGIFRRAEQEESKELYEKTPLQVLNDMREEVYNVVCKQEEQKSNPSKQNEETTSHFTWSACVIEGFTAFKDDELERLPYADLIRLLRKSAAVSILVFDERGGDLHLNADIILHMSKGEASQSAYQYQQMHIVKSDCQPHVRGWHKYRTVYGMKLIVYPSIQYLLMPRFEIDNAVPQLEHESLLYPQSLLQKFQSECVINATGPIRECAPEVMRSIFMGKKGAGVPFDRDNSTTSVVMVEGEVEYDRLYTRIWEQLSGDDTTLAVFLLGKTEQFFRQFINERQYTGDVLRSLHYWEVTSAYIWPEMFASVVKQYISRWKNSSRHHHLHIVLDDFANIGLYPLMNREPLLPYALANICRNATALRGFEGNDRGVRITLSMVCSSDKNTYFQTLCQLRENRDNKN